MTMPKTLSRAHALHTLCPLALALLGQLALLPGAAAQATAASTTPAAMAEPTLDISAFVIEGANPLSASDTERLLQSYTGPARKLSQIEQAAQALEKALREGGYIFHRVFVPVQKPLEGRVALQIIAFGIDKVDISGNTHFSTDNIRRSLPSLTEGSVPDVRQVGQDLSAANANPAKQVTVTFRESAKADAVDAALRVKDSNPITTFVSYSGNMPAASKNPDDGISRITGGIQHANLWDRDHVASVTYTTDPGKADKVALYGAYYQFPLYGRGLNLSAYYTSSDVNAGLGSLGLPDVNGRGQFLGARLTWSLPRSGAALQTLGVAVDDRHFDQGLPGTAVGALPLSLKYTYRRDESWGGYGGYAEYATNTEGGGRDNTAAIYTAQGADQPWETWRIGLDAFYRGSQWLWTAKLRGQASPYRLIAGEKLSLGGAGSVRGFTDAVVRGDSGLFWSLEASGPELMPQLRPLVFAEGGTVHSRGAASEELAALGVGLRWNVAGVDVSADLAYASKANSTETQQDPLRLHLAAFYRF